MKKLFSTLIVILAVILVLSFLKDIIIKTSVEQGVHMLTGLQLDIKKLKVGILDTLIDIKELRLFNPQGFPDEIMLDMPEIFVDYDLMAITKGKIHLPEIRIDMKEFNVIKDANGELNLNSLKVVKEQKKEEKAREPKEKGKMPEIQIDKLSLKIGKVTYKDYSKGGKPDVKEFAVNIDETFEDINDPKQLVQLIVVRALMGTTISKLANFDIGGLKAGLGETLGTAQKAVTDTVAAAQETLKETTKGAQEAVKETAKEAEEAVKELTESFKIPFGGAEEKKGS